MSNYAELCDVGDEYCFSDKIIKCSTNTHDTKSNQNHAEKYSLKNMVENYYKLYMRD